MANFLGFKFGSDKQIITPTMEKLDENIYAINSFSFNSDNQFLPSDYNFFSSSNGYVRYGADNFFPNRLVDLFYSSPLHQTAIKLKTLLIKGDGIEINEGLNQVKTDMWLNTITGSDNVEKLISDVTSDFEVFGSYHLLITWNLQFTKIMKVERLPSFGVRYGISSIDNSITEVFYCTDWKYANTKSSKSVIKYAPFNVLDKSNQQQVMTVRNTSIDGRVYAVPNYASGLNSIAANAAISLYQLSVIENGFNPGLAIKFYKKPSSPEEKDKIVKGIRQEYSGKKSAGKVMIFFSEGKDLAPDVQPVEVSNLDKQFTVLSQDIENNIIYSHNIISPLLLGVKTAGQLGNSTELQTAYMILEKTVVKNERKVIEDSLNKILKLNGMSTISIKPFMVFEEQVEVAVEEKKIL